MHTYMRMHMHTHIIHALSMGVGGDRETEKITEDPDPVQQMLFNRDECKPLKFGQTLC